MEKSLRCALLHIESLARYSRVRVFLFCVRGAYLRSQDPTFMRSICLRAMECLHPRLQIIYCLLWYMVGRSLSQARLDQAKHLLLRESFRKCSRTSNRVP